MKRVRDTQMSNFYINNITVNVSPWHNITTKRTITIHARCWVVKKEFFARKGIILFRPWYKSHSIMIQISAALFPPWTHHLLNQVNHHVVSQKGRCDETIQQAIQFKAPFGRASGAASRAAQGETLPNVCFVTGFTCEAGPEVIGGLHRQGEAMKSWLHAAYTSI